MRRFSKAKRNDVMSASRKTTASLCMGLLYLCLVVSYFVSIVIAFFVGGIPAAILWGLLASWIWTGLERILQFFEGKLR